MTPTLLQAPRNLHSLFNNVQSQPLAKKIFRNAGKSERELAGLELRFMHDTIVVSQGPFVEEMWPAGNLGSACTPSLAEECRAEVCLTSGSWQAPAYQAPLTILFLSVRWKPQMETSTKVTRDHVFSIHLLLECLCPECAICVHDLYPSRKYVAVTDIKDVFFYSRM